MESRSIGKGDQLLSISLGATGAFLSRFCVSALVTVSRQAAGLENIAFASVVRNRSIGSSTPTLLVEIEPHIGDHGVGLFLLFT